MKTILIVEDEQELAGVLETLLMISNYHVRTATDRQSFQKEMKECTPDLILMDVRLPDADGRQLCNSLKHSSEFGHVPVIIMSGETNMNEVYKDCEADDYLKKPFDVEELRAMISSHLN